MKVNGWKKHFIDGSVYVATDEEIKLRLKSWRNSRQENITEVEIYHDKLGLGVIRGAGEFWQEDHLIAPLTFSGSTEGSLVGRKIMKKIHEKDLFVKLDKWSNLYVCTFTSYPSSDLSGMLISPDLIGSWFCLTLDLRKKRIDYSIVRR